MADPVLPQADVEVPAFSIPTGDEHFPTTNAELQTAITNAALNDVIWLEAGTDYDGGVTLANKTTGSGWIYIISDAYLNLPAEGYRVAPADATNMARLSCSAGTEPIQSANSAHHYRLVGLHIEANTNQAVTNLITIERTSGTGTLNQPHHILIDRCYLHGQEGTGAKRRGIRMGGIHLGALGCYINNIISPGFDSQAILIPQGEGPFLIRNCFLEAVSENVMTGGIDVDNADMRASDITIEYNFFQKQEAWFGQNVQVKNIFESKSSQRMLVQYNVFNNCWEEDQDGAWTNITSNSDGSGDAWNQTSELTIRYNFAYNVSVGIGMNGLDGGATEDPVTNVLFENNVCLVGERNDGNRRCIDVTGEDGSPIGLTFRHNTILVVDALDVNSAAAFIYHPNTAAPDLTMTDNILSQAGAGVTDGNGADEGTASLDAAHTTYTFTTNAIIGASSVDYPANNFFPATIAAVQFTNYQADGSGDYSLAVGSPLKAQGSSGSDVGADWSSFKDQIAAAIAGTPFVEDSGEVRRGAIGGLA